VPDRLRPALLALAALAALAAPADGHDVGTSDAQSPLLAHGQGYNETAHVAGTHPYHCHVHPGMTGLLVVLPDADPAGPATHRIAIFDDGNGTHLRAMGFRDAAGGNVTTVRLGDRIAWTNEGALAHDIHIAWPASAGSDDGSFEVWVAAGLVVVLTGIFVAARRS
jgi:plastocyanin